MNVSVLGERIDANGFRATSLGLDVALEASTREAALDGLNRLLRQKFGNAELVCLEIPVACENHPWQPLVGRLREHPDWDEVEQHMGDYRRQAEEQGERL